jgi:hypothetical protein
MNTVWPNEVATFISDRYHSLNEKCRPTNTNVNDPKPYNHVTYQPEFTPEIDSTYE